MHFQQGLEIRAAGQPSFLRESRPGKQGSQVRGVYCQRRVHDLWKERIFITDVRPGAIDTGAYDNPHVQKAVLEIDKEYGNYFNETEIRKCWDLSN